MSFLKKIFSSTKEEPIKSNEDFWYWFEQNEKKFYEVIKQHNNIDRNFFSKLSPKLEELKDGIWFLTGMYNDHTAELILTPDGSIKNIAFIEELVLSAPILNNWKLTALKQPSKPNQYGIEMEGYKFDETTMNFYSIEHSDMPDEIDIVITHKDLNKENKSVITNGVYLSLDNSLGELNSVTLIDNLNVINPSEAEQELIPLEKINAFLIWREKEFIEKYEGKRHNTENDNYSSMEWELNNGLPLIAIVNTDLLSWDHKASHSWISVVKLKYDGTGNNGMPDQSMYELLDSIEDKIMLELKDSEGYLNIGRETADGLREIYFACSDFRKPSKVLYNIQQEFNQQVEFDYDIYKDKYWQSFNRFTNND
ncbi:MAG: DUF695 domain-containing protein [Flavobacteriales bacterium]|nr:DUF695 domain-containing protein [Flavobacteriales bacterium]